PDIFSGMSPFALQQSVVTWDQTCVPTRNCQDSMVMIDRQSASIYLYQVTTARSTNMISYPNVSVAKQADNIGFASTVTYWEA
ncbi:hypothetical protein C8J57DRAFT_1026002, partial [Mycena rebaudengoi]